MLIFNIHHLLNYILKDINLTIDPGEIVALVGPSGAGKTTLARLLTRLYDVDQGEIRLDGVNIKDISLGDLHELVIMVPQDVYLFPT